MPGVQTLAFEQYAGEMQPVISGLARRYVRAHPFLGEQDLVQECLIGLWQVWDRYRARVTRDELGRLGTRAAFNKLNETWRRTRYRGQGQVQVVPMAESVQTVPDPSTADAEELMLTFAIAEMDRMLSGVDQRVLHEILFPGVRTLAVTRALLQEKRVLRDEYLSVEVLAESLTQDPQAIVAAWERIQVAARTWLRTNAGPRHAIVEVDRKEAPDMEPSKTATNDPTAGLPDPETLGLGDDTPPAAPAPAASATDTGAKPSKKARATKEPSVKTASKSKPQAPKTDEKKPKAKESKKAKAPIKVSGKPASKPAKTPVVKVDKKHALAIGTKVKYLGGSKAAWLKIGTEGVIKQHHGNTTGVRYAIAFPDKRTVLAGHLVAKA